MSLAGYQVKSIDVNFHLRKSLEIFDKNSAYKIWSKKDKGWKVPCLMPIMVNGGLQKCQKIWGDKLNLPLPNSIST